ncbi:MAG: FAD:protein FMN transferase [Chloroflexota bacterium]
MQATRKAYWLKAGFLIIIMVMLLVLGQCGRVLGRFEETRSMMDTYVKVVIYAEESAASGVIDAAFARMEEVVMIASTFDSEAEAFQLNQAGYRDNPSAELLELINMSLEYGELTDGSFDITIQPLLDLWQFNPDAAKQFWELDSSVQQEEINQALKLVGPDKIVLAKNRISFKVDGMEITLGGIAKGYVVDEALEVIASMGVKSALIDAGGDIGTLGSKPSNEPWTVSLVNPDDTTQSLATFNVTGRAVATSGNYERYFDPDKTVHHIMDPRTGFSASECISVTIIAEGATRADTLATGVFVMGPEDGLRLVELLDNVECFIVDANREIHLSSGLYSYLK